MTSLQFWYLNILTKIMKLLFSACCSGILLIPLPSLCWIGTIWVGMMQQKSAHNLVVMMMCIMKRSSSAHHACIGKVCDWSSWYSASYQINTILLNKQ